MNISTTLITALMAAGAVMAQGSATLSVTANMDIYRAGGYNDRSDGAPPVDYVFPARAGRTLAFSSVSGTWTCGAGTQFGPDGTIFARSGCRPPTYIVGPWGTFSGYFAIDFVGALVGMFLEDSLPPSAATALHFYVNNSSNGGIKTDFKVLRPSIGQVFFIGDGLTGTGTGSTQGFLVPPTATHLYLGFADSCAAPKPGCYFDNVGTVTATFGLYDVP